MEFSPDNSLANQYPRLDSAQDCSKNLRGTPLKEPIQNLM